jgi:hypothetical protein
VALDLRTRRTVTAAPGSGWIFPTSTTVQRGPVLSVSRAGYSASLLSVVYVSPTGARPLIRWYPGRRAGTGTARIWWGRIYRDIVIDSTGIR